MIGLQNALILAHPAGWDHAGDGWWFVFPVFWGLIWFALIGFIIWRVWRGGWRHEVSGIERARGILAERYARGEINAEEYQERLGRLR